jgi:hypothetical protein
MFHSYVSLPEGKWIRLPPGTSNLLTSAGNWCQPWPIRCCVSGESGGNSRDWSRSHPMNILHPKWLQKWWIPQLLPYLNHPKSFTVWFSWEKYGKMMINQYQPISTMRFWDRSLFSPGHVRPGVTGPPSHSVRPLRSSTDRMLGPRRRDLKVITKEHRRLAGLLERPIIFEQVIGNDYYIFIIIYL